MLRKAAFLLLAFITSNASAETTWGAGSHSRTTASGDILDSAGATVTLSGEPTRDAKFITTFTSLDATPYRGQDVRLAGDLSVEEGMASPACGLERTALKVGWPLNTPGANLFARVTAHRPGRYGCTYLPKQLPSHWAQY